ncbi:Asp-tRNA(Asn)/Glu-tRNA(Gln) amidotransferase subunit GatC [Futiania mangrovi]|uniref:Aspartyl/glutamyl-tRNA(Asn/Gln) amidotransferase subunit C n=1 Tax=Futiania mangrovi TaxID=2959716 RepID=A0A9J6P939_9PROT|nr:Asp-tRNA(Asn)/Glu-tRNA(Gln) amidotransferase subunit GatC [Futiania mangrovii]MCP1335269.1 Asp-tRNA(Asn)/Glu-tRNA(Gln) amidotransferase subunit GatC [Futiania mangrovii]
MSVDDATVRRIAHLSRIALKEEEVQPLKEELNGILAWVEQLGEVPTDDVPPMTSVTPMALTRRADFVTDGGYPDDIVKNAPMKEDGFFMVPTVVE